MSKHIFLGLSILSLLACLVSPVLHFMGMIEAEVYKASFLISSAAWFLFAFLFQFSRRRKR